MFAFCMLSGFIGDGGFVATADAMDAEMVEMPKVPCILQCVLLHSWRRREGRKNIEKDAEKEDEERIKENKKDRREWRR